jgi:glutathione S-transferase
MKLYNADLSPYASRVRLQLYLKGIKAEILPPPGGGIHTPEFAKINPLERLPAIDDNGFHLPESSAILEYIEDTHPTPSLRPADAKERARMRVLYNIADDYILGALTKLFGQANPATRDAKITDAALTDLAGALKGLDHYLSGAKWAQGTSPTIADCAIVPALFFVGALGPFFGQGDLMASTPKVKAYWASVQTDAHVAKIVQEQSVALQERIKQGV